MIYLLLYRNRMTIRSASSVPQRPFSRDFILRRQTPGSASNIRFIIKLQKPVDPHTVLSLNKEKHLLGINDYRKNLQSTLEPSQILPTAFHS